MTIKNEEIKDHIGHKIEAVSYNNENYCIECVTCNMVLFEWTKNEKEIEIILSENIIDGCGEWDYLEDVFTRDEKMDVMENAWQHVLRELFPDFSITVYIEKGNLVDDWGELDYEIINNGKTLERVWEYITEQFPET